MDLGKHGAQSVYFEDFGEKECFVINDPEDVEDLGVLNGESISPVVFWVLVDQQ